MKTAEFAIGSLAVSLPVARLAPAEKSSALVWGSLAFAAVLDHEGYAEIAKAEVEKISAWLGREPTRDSGQARIELSPSERGRAARDLKRLDRLNARLAQPMRKGDERAEKQRERDLRERDQLESAPAEVADKAWRDAAADETARLARARGEDVQRSKSGAVRVNSRDPLKSLLAAGRLTADEHDTAVGLRDAYEARSEGVGSQLGAINAIGSAHDNDRYVMGGLQRAKALQRIGSVERTILLSPLFAERGSVAAVGLQMLRAVCSEGKSLSSQGEGRTFERNLLALTISLEVAKQR